MGSILDVLIDMEKLSPKPGDVVVVTIPTGLDYESFQAVFHCLETLSTRPQFEGVQIVLSYPEHQWKNMDLAQLRDLRDKLNEAIYDKERQR